MPPYQWPPPRDHKLDYAKKPRNPIYSLVTALPIIMLVVALSIYYRSESRQNSSPPIRSESLSIEAVFTGISTVGSGAGRHYLWVDYQGNPKGIRVAAQHTQALQVLERDKPVSLKIAPTISGSDTYWAWYVEQADVVILDDGSRLQ